MEEMTRSESRIIVYTCNWGAYSGLETAGFQGLSYPANVHPIRVMCLGRLHSGLVLKAFELGAAGVMMLGCPPGECHYGSGNQRAEEVFQETLALARLLGIEEDRLMLDWVAAGEGQHFVDQVRQFVDRVAKVGGSVLQEAG
jgi:F420-non-reducing hydrogenase iron-sulfur subunit